MNFSLQFDARKVSYFATFLLSICNDVKKVFIKEFDRGIFSNSLNTHYAMAYSFRKTSSLISGPLLVSDS